MTLAELLANATPGPWSRSPSAWETSLRSSIPFRDEDVQLMALAPDLARLALDMGEALRADEMSFETADALLARLDGIGNKDKTT